MFRLSMRTAAFATMIAALLVAPGVTWAQAVKTPVAGTTINVATTDPGETFVDEDGIVHMRGVVIEQQVLGDVVGVQTVTFDANFDPLTGDGDVHGFFEFTGTALGLTGTFEGRFGGPLVGGVFFFSTTAQGSGDFDGMKKMTTGQTIAPNVFSYEGRILSPQGF